MRRSASRRAREHLEALIQLAPDDRWARSRLALELAAAGDLEGALLVVDGARRRFGAGPELKRLEERVRSIHAKRR